uniref:Signal peptide peptidase SppA n=1 Tax=candidate division WOR-3 bacterium TaxID=2052148 RepID=A0A7C3UXW3_UNCW3
MRRLLLFLPNTLLLFSYPLSVATTDDALAIIQNPALLAPGRDLNFYLFFNHFSLITPRPETISERFFSFASQFGNLGFFYQDKPRTYYFGGGFKISNLSIGLRYEYTRFSSWDFGLAYRYRNLLSLGMVLTGWKKENPIIPGIALKPIKEISLYYEGMIYRLPTGSHHFFGLEVIPQNGLELKFKMDEERNFALGFSLGFGQPGLGFSFSRTPGLKERLSSESYYLSYHKEEKASILPPVKKYLEIELSGEIADLPAGFSLLFSRRKRVFYELLATIEKAKRREEINALLLKISPDFSLTLSQAEELKSCLVNFKKEGKKVFIYTPNLNTINFFLATSADKIIVHPLGDIAIKGIYLRTIFLANLLKKLGIEVEVERVGRYKSAPETFTEERLTEENREQLEALLDDLYQVLLAAFAERGFTREAAESIINQGIFLPEEAKEKKIFDLIAYEGNLDSIVRKETKAKGGIKERKFQKIKPYNYYWGEKKKMAIIYINGSIDYGESYTDFLTGEYHTGCQTIARYLRKVKDNPMVKVVILRIDSPGGDAFASDIIWREVENLKRKKPVYVSMSSLAASGGYYCASTGKEIFANNSTITGSIGVFGIKFVTKGLMEKAGVNEEILKRGEKADFLSSHRHFTPEEREQFKKVIENFYDQFKSKVATGRNLPKEKVDSLGQGRIWSGKSARELRLIDKIGGLIDLIHYLQEKYNLTDCEIVHYPPLSPFRLW